MRRALWLLLPLLFGLLVPAAHASADEGRIIVARDPGLSASERADIRADAGVELLHTLRLPNTEVVTTDDPQDALATLRRDDDVRYAEIDRVRHGASNDPYFGAQWALSNDGDNVARYFGGATGTPDADMDVPEAWAQSTGGGVVVAVVDTVVQADHPDLAGNLASSANFVSQEADTTDPSYQDERDHGTHVAGIIAAERDNAIGVSGIAPDARIMSLRALNDGGSGYDSDIASAFDYAGAHGARIVNASLGGPGGDGRTFRDAIARHPNTLYVVAAGNGGSDGVGDDNDATPEWPCDVAEPNVVCVGASTQDDTRASFSNYGLTNVDLFAPGEYIASTVRGGYGGMSGTSMASPAVAAEAALVLAADPTLSAAAVKSALLGTVDPKPAFSGNSVSGGRANAQAAVARVAPAAPPSSSPAPQPQPVSTPAPVAPAPAPADRDGDGRPDSADACPAEAAATVTGCPVPALRSLRVSVDRHRVVAARVRADRSARISARLERRVCARGLCRYRRVAAKTASLERLTLSRRVSRGRYRVTVRLSSAAGGGATARRTIRVR